MIRAILFDLGDTLMCPVAAWPPVLERADRAVVEVLVKNGLGLDFEHFHEEFKARLLRYYAERDSQQIETSTTTVLQELLTEKGYTGIPPALLRAALDARYRISQSNWQLADDAITTLETLKARGYQMGIVSNAGDNKDVFQLVNKFDIDPYFDFVLTSAACGWRKPNPRIFELALAHWGYPASQAVMVGDKLDADISGANQVGIFSIWVTRYARIPEHTEIQPTFTVASLTESIEAIAALA
jgi:putative hydrolase of the HAD superfamily